MECYSFMPGKRQRIEYDNFLRTVRYTYGNLIMLWKGILGMPDVIYVVIIDVNIGFFSPESFK